MALQKEHETENGLTGNYWKIITVTPHHNNSGDSFRVALFVSKESFHSQKEPIFVKDYHIEKNSPFTIEKMSSKNVFQLSEEWLISKIEFFNDAILEE